MLTDLEYEHMIPHHQFDMSIYIYGSIFVNKNTKYVNGTDAKKISPTLFAL